MKLIVCGDYIVGEKLPYNDMMGDLQDFLNEADFKLYNQEHPITEHAEIFPVKKFGPNGACSSETVMPLIKAGFNVATLANNHIFNRGVVGLQDTLTFFNKHKVFTVGANVDIETARKPLILEKGQVKVAVFNFAETEFNQASHKHGGANPLNLIENARQIKSCKDTYGNVLVIIHGGIEYCPYPSSRMVEQYRYYVDCGASAIICHHSHIVSSYEEYAGVPIYYGIGNFIPLKYAQSIFKSQESRKNLAIRLEFGKEGLQHQSIPFIFDNVQNKLVLIQNEALIEFHNYQEQVNAALMDLEELDNRIYKEFMVKDKSMYYKILFSRSNYFIYKVFRKVGLLNVYYPFIRRKMKLNKETSGQWNLHRCESHRDILELIYQNEIDIYRN